MQALDGEWDGHASHRKPHGATQSSVLGVVRNDRTPLNTPYTPHLVKLQLLRHEESTHGMDECVGASEQGLMMTLLASGLQFAKPLHHARLIVDRVMVRLLPRGVVTSRFFTRHRYWIVWYLTSLLSIPFVLLLSPMIIAFCICTSPIWVVGGLVLAIRALVPSGKPASLETEYLHPRACGHGRSSVNGHARVNGVTTRNCHPHPRAHATPDRSGRGVEGDGVE